MKNLVARVFLISMVLSSAICEVRAQQISGFSTVQELPAVYPCRSACVQAYTDTEEDYTASLYYDVQSTSALYAGGGNSSVANQTFAGNPSASGSYYVILVRQLGMSSFPDTLYTEVTAHIVDFFYVTSVGEYYDPFGFSVMNGGGDGGYDSGYWFSIDGIAAYIVEASAELGESYDSTNVTTQDLEGPAVKSVLYQGFIPPDWVTGPPSINCVKNIYAGDNRTFNPALGSYRVMQQASAGVGGAVVDPSPAQATGWSFQFSQTVLQNNIIPSSAYNFNFLGQCSSSGVNAYGQASTSNMVPPTVSYNGGTTSVAMSGSALDPIPLFSLPVSWNVMVNLTEPIATDLHVTGILNATCYPAHEVSVGSHDVTTWNPAANDLGYLTGCLAGLSPVTQLISSDIILGLPGLHRP